MRTHILFALLLTLATACGKSSHRSSASPVDAATAGNPKDPGGTGVADTITFSTIASQVYTQDTSADSCVQATITATKAGAPIADVGITVTIQTAAVMDDKGKVTPDSATTGADGTLAVAYCSGKTEGTVTLIAKAGAITVNSSKILITKKPSYAFVYSRSDLDDSSAVPKDGGVINLNVLDSGPNDCTTVYFNLTKSGAPIVGESITFGTQVDYPKASKLAKKADAGTSATDPITNKKYATYKSTSSGAGDFPVPVCAGVSLGTLVISGSYTDPDEGRTYKVQSPVIRITSGLTNYINFSLTFNPSNARTLKAYYNTNSDYDLPFEVQLGARFDGRAITDYPIIFATEVGRYTLENGGVADATTNSVKAELHALHATDNYPYPVINFGSTYPLAQTRCDPAQIAAWAAANGRTKLSYYDLSMNWRSTAVYAIRGQEYYYDANRNGLYDEGGDGFWDKNQNGVFDAGDVLTYDAGNNGFDPNSEWFIDLPTPFVDVDEDGVFDATKDYLLGDQYVAPNGKRDADALIWKKEIFPIGMGASPYGLMTKDVKAGAAYSSPDSFYKTTNHVFGVNNITQADLWTGSSEQEANYPFAFFAHDLCGNLLPGGTKFAVTFEPAHAGDFGPRNPEAHFGIQPDDIYREPARQLLKNVAGDGQGTINFNEIEHPTASDSYPILGNLYIPPCTNQCTGVLSTTLPPGNACDAWVGKVHLTITEPDLDKVGGASTTITASLNTAQYNGCNCGGDPTEIIQAAGVCRCSNPNANWDTTAGHCVLP